MAIDWSMAQAPNVAGNFLQALQAGRQDSEHRQDNALATQQRMASEDRATQDRHRTRAAQFYTALLSVPEAQRHQAALQGVADLGLDPEELARVTATINDPQTTWDDQTVRARVQFLGGEVPQDTFQSSPNGLYRVPGTGDRSPVLVPGSQRPPPPGPTALDDEEQRARISYYGARVPLAEAQAERARRPPAGRSGGGGGRAAGGGIRSGGSGADPAW